MAKRKLVDRDPIATSINEFMGETPFESRGKRYHRVAGVKFEDSPERILIRQKTKRGIISGWLRTEQLEVHFGTPIGSRTESGEDCLTEEYVYIVDGQQLHFASDYVPMHESPIERENRWAYMAAKLHEAETLAKPQDWRRFNELMAAIGSRGIRYTYDEA